MLPTDDDIRRLFPRATDAYVRMFTGNGRLLATAGLAEPLPLCHFLARIGAETGELTITEENGNYSAARLREVWPKRFTPAQARVYAHRPQAILSRAYARRELGNGGEATGDGWTYRGRGPLQTTGRDNYRRMGARIGVDLVAKPDLLASDLTLGLKAALLEWSDLDLGAICARLGPTHEAVLAVARGINLGNPQSRKQPNGLAQQKAIFARAWKMFGNGVAAKVDPAADGVLQDGEEGEAVRVLQLRLRALGYPVGEADGIFGERTEAAVAAFAKREPEILRSAKIVLPAGRWSTAWDAHLDLATPFADAARKDATAADLAAKGDSAVTMLGWLRAGGASAAAFLGLDQAADRAGVQLPETLTGLREIVDPLAVNLGWLMGSKWVLGIVAAIGVWALSGAITNRIVARYRSFGNSEGTFTVPGQQAKGGAA